MEAWGSHLWILSSPGVAYDYIDSPSRVLTGLGSLGRPALTGTDMTRDTGRLKAHTVSSINIYRITHKRN